MPRSFLVFTLMLAAVACDGPVRPDGGTPLDSGPDSSALPCTRDSECGDQSLFCADWRCRPGESGTDARGCIDLGSSCEPGQTCDEETDSCGRPSWCTKGRDGCRAAGDCDGDGELAPECGGDDCDDDDELRYPRATEVCDPAGVDEDCNTETLAGAGDGDLDGDTFVSAGCCNTQSDGSLSCGDDCEDGDVNVNPDASETCNGADDDCDGTADIGGGLCPGGLCSGGRCDFDAWDRVVGGAESDQADSVAFDASGNIYVAGAFRGTVDFGGGERTSPVSGASRSLFVVKYGPDGTYAWDYVSPRAATLAHVRLATDAAGTRVYVTGAAGVVDFGGGATAGGFLLVLDGAGAYRVDRRFARTGTQIRDVAVNGTGVALTGVFDRPVDFGGGERAATRATIVVAQFDADGDYAWDRTFGGATSSAYGSSIASAPGGGLVIGGQYFGGALDIGESLPAPLAGGQNSFVARLDGAGAPIAAHAMTSPGGSSDVAGVAVNSAGELFAVGSYRTAFDPGVGGPYATRGGNGFVVGFGSDATPIWSRSYGSNDGDEAATAVTVDATGNVLVVGEFATDTDFGGGLRRPPAQSGFLARYTSAGVHQRDYVYSSGFTRVGDVAVGPGNATVICGLFTGTSDFGSGVRVSAGMADAFILRLGS